MISSIFSFEMTKVISFPALTASFHCIFIWIAPSIAENYGIVANCASTFLAKWTGTFINGPANLAKNALINPPDWINLDNCGLLRLIFLDVLIAKAFLILVYFDSLS